MKIRFCKVLICILAFSNAGSISAQVGARAGEVEKILQSADWNNSESVNNVENKLADLGEKSVPTLQTIIAEKRVAMSQMETNSTAPLGASSTLRQEIDLMDSAAIRLTWKINPHELIEGFIQKATAPNSQRIPPYARPGRILDASIENLFPNTLFYPMIIRQYPVARIVPPPFKAQNIFVVQKAGALQHLPDIHALENFFRSSLTAPVNPNEAWKKDAVRAWLRLSEEFSQDGMFKFSTPEQAISILAQTDGWKGTGKATVIPQLGNMGEITAALFFKADGTLERVSETRNVKAGMRPICQATKLLDADAIARAMAEQDILIMGREAEWYLAEQKAKASPALQSTIEKIWERIVTEGR